MAKLRVKAVLSGKMLSLVKQGAVCPVNNKALETDLKLSIVKLAEYEEGRKAFLTCVRIMADSLLRELSLTSKKIVLTLTANEYGEEPNV